MEVVHCAKKVTHSRTYIGLLWADRQEVREVVLGGWSRTYLRPTLRTEVKYVIGTESHLNIRGCSNHLRLGLLTPDTQLSNAQTT